MPSQIVVRRQRQARALRTSLNQHKEALLEGLQLRHPLELGDGAALQGYEQLHQFFLDALAGRLDAMVRADDEHSVELMDDREPRRRRELAADQAHRVLLGVRRAATGFFGTEGAAELLNMEGETSRDPVTLYRQGVLVMERLRDPELELPPSLLSGAPDREGWAALLEPALSTLREALDEVGGEEREAALTRALRNQTIADHDQDFNALARILEGFLLLAGRRDLSDDVRPGRLRRRARRAAEEPGKEPSTQPGTVEPTGSTGETAPADAS